jgi:sterol desaturase/sphingolipid hydroxylase (fatty acid hydroxylase superfamily)
MDIIGFITPLGIFAQFCAIRAVDTLTAPSSRFSLLSLASAFLIAGAVLKFRHRKGKRLPIRVLLRALIPRRWFRSPSGKADLGLAAINTFVTGLAFGWALYSAEAVEHAVIPYLNVVVGTQPLVAIPALAGMAVLTLACYIAFEFAYFADHYLSHHIPLLWHFHRVHHTADTLSPATVFRVHPVDTIVFYNFTAVCVGVVSAVVKQTVGLQTGEFAVGGYNVILLGSLYLIAHLHHSEMWIPFTGRLGQIVMSPAHHQLHHSANPAHYNRNFGNSFAGFDRLFGTLLMPSSTNERLKFGADPSAYNVHGISGLLLQPFAEAAQTIVGDRPSPQPPSPDVDTLACETA